MSLSGISPEIKQSILAACHQFPRIKRVILFGSRARGDYRPGSDIDIAIDAPDMTDQEFSQLWNALDDLPIIYSMDIIHLQSLNNEQLLAAISSEGRDFIIE